jgi:hypothetical protein
MAWAGEEKQNIISAKRELGRDEWSSEKTRCLNDIRMEGGKLASSSWGGDKQSCPSLVFFADTLYDR